MDGTLPVGGASESVNGTSDDPKPTETPMTWPARLMVSPSSMRRTLPKMEMSTLSTSKLGHILRTPEGNSTVSSAVASDELEGVPRRNG